MHRRLLQLAASTRPALALTIACGLLAGLLTILQAWLVSSTIEAVFLAGRTLPQVMGWMQLVLLVIAGRGALAWLGETAACAVAVPIKNSLRRRLFSHILELGPAHPAVEHTGELTAAAVEGVEALDAYYRQYLPQLVVSTLVPLCILAIVFPRDPLSGVILLLTAPLIPFFMYMIGKGAEAATGRRYEILGRLSSYFLDSLQGLTTLKVFGQSRAQAANIASVSDQFRDATLRVLQVTFLSALALELLATLSTAIIAVEVGLRLLYARMEFREALFILILAPEFYLPLRMLGLRFHAGMSGVSAAGRIFQILDIPSLARPASLQAPRSIPASFKLELRDVAFIHPGASDPALMGINLFLEPGRHIALVGPSGAGKTILVNLLLRFIEPSRGCILLDGRPLSDIPLDRWREMIAWVPQMPHLFNGSIASNIRLGRPLASDPEVVQAARLAHLHEFVESLPEQYETPIGEGGARLSSGQAQRLALARAFLKDSPILLMDEPTSSLDPETEAMLEEAIRRLTQGRTVITIAHRLNTVYQADRILVLDGGRLVEAGTHRELVKRGGVYAAMAAPYLPEVNQAGQESTPELNPSPTQAVEPQPVIVSSPAPSQQGGIGVRLLDFLRGSWRRVALSILLSTLTIGASVALMGTSAWMISMAALHPSIAALGVSVVGVRFFGISRGVFRYLERLISHEVTFRLLARLRVWFYERLEPLAPARLMDFRLGDLLARIVSDVETLESFYVRVLAPPLAAVLVAVGTALVLALWDARLVLILITLYLLLGLPLPLVMQGLSRQPGARLITERSRLNARLVDGIQGLADLAAFGRGRDELAGIEAMSRSYSRAERMMARLGGLEAGSAIFVPNLALWSVLLLCIPLFDGGALGGVMLAPLALLTMASFEAVTPLPTAARTWSASREAARRLFEVVDAPPAVMDQPGGRGQGAIFPANSRLPSLEVRDLCFTYPGRSGPALDGVSFKLEQGESAAIVGPSGAGKSTLAWLLLRFWPYDCGDIFLAGCSLSDYTQDAVRAQIGFVSAKDHIFNTTLRENLRMARRGLSSSEIEQAAVRARIHDSILRMPHGYDTLAGERGMRLSGGERQRLALARTLLKDAPLLLLDEPTANLDPLTEHAVLETLFELMKSKTTLLITHRLIGLEHMDQILVMNHGRIVERGTHAGLLQRGGIYRRLWELQNRRLADHPLFQA